MDAAADSAPSATEEDPEPCSLLDSVLGSISEANRENLEKLLHCPENEKELKNAAWDLVPRICTFLSQEVLDENPDIIELCDLTFSYLVDIGNPKELLLALLEQADTFMDDVRFKSLLLVIQKCLLKLPSKRGHSVALALETLYTHVMSLPLPKEYNLEEEEKAVLSMDENVFRINEVLAAILKFLEPFVKEVSYKHRNSQARDKNYTKQVNALRTFLMKTLGHPVAFLDLSLTHLQNGKVLVSKGREKAETMVNLLSEIQGDHHKTIQLIIEENDQIMRDRKKRAKRAEANRVAGEIGQMEDNYDLVEPISQLSLSCLAYLSFGEDFGADSLPQVFPPVYLLRFNCKFVAILLHQTDELIVFKGIKLLESSLDKLAPMALEAEMMDLPEVKGSIQRLLHVTTSNAWKSTRTSAIKLLPLFLDKFESKGRYVFLSYLLNTSSHPGLFGYVTGLLKQEIHTALMQMPPCKDFVGSRLECILKLVFKLPSGAECDLLEQNEKIISALNLLRYVVLRDKPQDNITGIWNYISGIESEYCQTLRSSLNLSRAHYELDFNKLKAESGESKKLDDLESMMSLTVGGEPIPELTKEQKIHTLTLAFHTFDMMESVLVRVDELLDQQKKTIEKI